jgi:hypothetical protein
MPCAIDSNSLSLGIEICTGKYTGTYLSVVVALLPKEQIVHSRDRSGQTSAQGAAAGLATD